MSRSPIIECVPNFSEGCDAVIINKIADEIRSVLGVQLLHIDAGKAANRTVITFAGSPESVIEAAFLAIKKAAELIDMSKQKGEHPRIGATDVCPLIPISGISLEETSAYAHKLGEKVGNELNIPVYMYEASQQNKERANLAIIRSGEYEGFFEKIKLSPWKPDYGPSVYSEKAGATVIGARDFLVAYNINLNTTSEEKAKIIANQIRESGTVKRKGNPLKGEIIRDENGLPQKINGSLKSVKAIGWFIKEYEAAQVSLNLCDINVTPLHLAFESVCKKALENGVQVTGSEIIGLIPLKALLDAGKHFQQKQRLSENLSEKDLLALAVKALGLNEYSSFKPEEKIIEYLLSTNA